MICILRNFLPLCILFATFNTINAQTSILKEAEDATLSGTAEIVMCSNASGGEMVKGLDNTQANAILIENISVPEQGEYNVTVSYFATSDRNLSYRLNGGALKSLTVPPSGAWCYQGGFPNDYNFIETFRQGDNSILLFNAPIIDKLVVSAGNEQRQPLAFYVSSSGGSDDNDGLTASTPWQTLAKLNALHLIPGDTLLLKSGDTFIGELVILNEGGSEEHPIVISNYGEGKAPVLEGDGYLSAIHVVNSGYVHLSNLEISNNGGQAKPNHSENLRYGLYIENTLNDGTIFEHYRLKSLTFQNIYPTNLITDNDQTGVHAYAITTSGSWGDSEHPTRFKDMQIENCYFTRTGRHAVVLKSVNNLLLRNNVFEHVGGAGMVIGGNCTNILVEHNTTKHTGSSIDSRMAGRGSGIWCYQTQNLTVQHNNFMYARGIKDSYGMHIDIGNRNVVYQYNYSEGNEGGFVEVLGKNVNVGYRYNTSVADGWRKRGIQKGQIFWLAGWSGNPQNPIGSDSIFVYNNSVYVPDTIAPGILIEAVSKNARIYNNIINVAGSFGAVVIKNNSDYNDFDYNIWHGNIPLADEEGENYRGTNAIIANPLYADAIVTDSSGFVLQKESPAIRSGKLMYDVEESSDFDYFFNHGGRDYYGNPVSDTERPNIGAFNGTTDTGLFEYNVNEKDLFQIQPNIVQSEMLLNIHQPLQNACLTITTLNGAVLKKDMYSLLAKGKLRLDVGAYNNGMYLVCIEDGKACCTRRFIKL